MAATRMAELVRHLSTKQKHQNATAEEEWGDCQLQPPLAVLQERTSQPKYQRPHITTDTLLSDKISHLTSLLGPAQVCSQSSSAEQLNTAFFNSSSSPLESSHGPGARCWLSGIQDSEECTAFFAFKSTASASRQLRSNLRSVLNLVCACIARLNSSFAARCGGENAAAGRKRDQTQFYRRAWMTSESGIISRV